MFDVAAGKGSGSSLARQFSSTFGKVATQLPKDLSPAGARQGGGQKRYNSIWRRKGSLPVSRTLRLHRV